MAYFEEEQYNKPFDIKIFRHLFPFMQPYKKLLLFICIFTVVTSGVDMLIPMFQRYAINTFIGEGNTDGIVPFAGIYFSFVAMQFVNTVVFVICALTLEMRTGRDMKRALFVRLQHLSFTYYNVTPVGYMLSRVMDDTNRIAGNISWSLLDGLWSIVYILGVFVIMFSLNAQLALLIMLIVPAAAIVTVLFRRRMLDANRAIRRANSQVTRSYNESIGGARTSKVLVIEDANYREFQGLTQDVYKHSMHATRLQAIFIPIISLFGTLAVSLVLVRGGKLNMAGTIDFGTFSAFLTYGMGIFDPIRQLARIFTEMISMQSCIERVVDLLHKEPDIQDSEAVTETYGDTFAPKKENWEPVRGDIEFCDVTFQYPDGDENVLEHFNLKIPAGTNVAIVGETGAGKSTIVNLACRFFEPTEGKILIDGKDYRERSQLWLQSNLGYVLQNPHLFTGSIRENIRYGKLDATDEEVEAAAKIVSVDKIAARMQNGYDTDVGESGDLLSTGEKQLISYARALIANPPIFVLDEATSSIDTETEQLIQDATAHILAGRTAFMIAHRLSTIQMADIILVVHDGKIIERGTHSELMQKKGHYWELYTKQFEADVWKQAVSS